MLIVLGKAASTGRNLFFCVISQQIASTGGTENASP